MSPGYSRSQLRGLLRWSPSKQNAARKVELPWEYSPPCDIPLRAERTAPTPGFLFVGLILCAREGYVTRAAGVNDFEKCCHFELKTSVFSGAQCQLAESRVTTLPLVPCSSPASILCLGSCRKCVYFFCRLFRSPTNDLRRFYLTCLVPECYIPDHIGWP